MAPPLPLRKAALAALLVMFFAPAARARGPIFGGVEAADDPKGDRLFASVVRVMPAGCSGTVIFTPPKDKPEAGSLVLTAAHCYEPGSWIVAGKEPRRVDSDAFGIAEGYDPKERFSTRDLALMRFKEDLSAFGLMSPALRREAVVPKDTELLAAGYGNSNGEIGSSSGSGRLRSARLKVTEDAGAGIFVDASKGSGVCSGDSGGPAFLEESGGLVLVAVITQVIIKDCRRESIFLKLPAGLPTEGFVWTEAESPPAKTVPNKEAAAKTAAVKATTSR